MKWIPATVETQVTCMVSNIPSLRNKYTNPPQDGNLTLGVKLKMTKLSIFWTTYLRNSMAFRSDTNMVGSSWLSSCKSPSWKVNALSGINLGPILVESKPVPKNGAQNPINQQIRLSFQMSIVEILPGRPCCVKGLKTYLPGHYTNRKGHHLL